MVIVIVHVVGIEPMHGAVHLLTVQQQHLVSVVVVTVDWLVHTVPPSPVHPIVLAQLPSCITPVPWLQYVCLATSSAGRTVALVTIPD